ncbi:hypothetical protein [Marinobacter sp. SS13-12]|uniref:hypothetical protein n=1 Tax=Marinobacter sp. SS13-12 TaxID=3050451 RepID=UPI002554370A|nr:hypothetical protein [Marinobacter sp. SS13-12]MDK8463265.1 hypothetical protein [Marinobacter sp. SS13-12]
MNAVLLPILPPLIAALAVLILRRGGAALALAGATLSLVGSLWLLARVAGGQAETLLLPGLPDMPLRLVAGPMTSLVAVAVATVGTFVLIYAVGYMKQESGQARFYAVMTLFLASHAGVGAGWRLDSAAGGLGVDRFVQLPADRLLVSAAGSCERSQPRIPLYPQR